MSEVLETFIRSIAAFLLLLFTAHFLGKQTISKMTYHDFIASIMIGSITANLAFNSSLRSWHIVTALFTFTVIVYISTYIALKSRKARKFLSGQPTVIIQNGKILEENLRKLKYTLDSLNQALRSKGVFNVHEVEYAVVEANGSMSILKKPDFQPVTRKDLQIFSSSKLLFPIELIMQGEIIKKNLQQNHLTEQWLDSKLKERGLSLQDVVYCVQGTDGKLYFDLFDDELSSPLDIET